MLNFVVGLLLVLHGIVHLLFAGQSARLFELRSGLAWPDDSWAFARLIGNDATRTVAVWAFTLMAIGFVAGGVALMFDVSWWKPVAVASAILAIVFTLLLWDGNPQELPDKGGLGLLIDAGILISVVALG